MNNELINSFFFEINETKPMKLVSKNKFINKIDFFLKNF